MKKRSCIFATFREIPQSYAASDMAYIATGLLTGMYTGAGYEVYYYDSEGREIQRYATGYNCGRRCTAYNYDGTIASRTYSYKESYLPDMEEVYAYDSCGRLTSTTIRVDKAVPAPIPNPAVGQDAADSEATDTAITAASPRWATAVIRREYDAIGRLARLRHGDAAVTEYSYDVHSWQVSLQTTYGTGTSSSATAQSTSIGYTLEYAPCYNGNISKRTWSEGSYTYTYDAFNRLSSAVFTPAEGLADRPSVERDRIPDFSVYYDYDLRGNTTNVVRYGVVDAVSDFDRVETFGTLDELVCAYEGNQLRSMTAMSEALPFNGITGLHANGDYEMTYNAAGDLVRDPSRGVLRTQWNADGHPSQYDLEGGHRHRLGWDNTGNHLYTSYETSVTTVSAGQLAGRTRRTALRAYTGDGHVLCGGEGNSIADSIEMIRFDGGYFDADLVPHYYIADYLDSNIAVIDADGDLVQTATYYPYGEPHRNPLIRRGIDVSTSPSADAATAAEPRTANLTQNETRTANPYLYGDKEWMYQDGLREYVYGARMHVPSLPRFTSIDPLAEKHPEQTPYLFCGANPIRFVDPSGCIFTAGAERILVGLNQQIESQITDNYAQAIKHLSNYLKSGKKNGKEFKKAIQSIEKANKYIEVRDEIDVLRNSNTRYNILVEQSADSSVKGKFGIRRSSLTFRIIVRDKDAYGWIAHELKHAYQFETGKLSAQSKITSDMYYDLTDEEEAFERGRLFGTDMPNIDYKEYPYKHLSNKAKQVDPNKTDQEYQAIANEKNIYFKINGKLYIPQ